jgi:hypothetical protein
MRDRFKIQNIQAMDDLKELQGCIYAFLDHKAALAQRFTFYAKLSLLIMPHTERAPKP